MFRSPILALVALAGLSLPLLGTAPAAATPSQRFDINDPFSNTIHDYCGVSGLNVRNVGVFHSRLKIHPRQGTAYFLEHIHVTQTQTGVRSGVSVTIKTAFIQKDLKITDNGDGTFTIIALLTGPSSVYGPDGKAIARDPGQVRFRIVIDDNGTPDNFDDDFEVSSDLIKGSTGRSDDFCAAIVPVIG